MDTPATEKDRISIAKHDITMGEIRGLNLDLLVLDQRHDSSRVRTDRVAKESTGEHERSRQGILLSREVRIGLGGWRREEAVAFRKRIKDPCFEF